jgi:hypothetical protein
MTGIGTVIRCEQCGSREWLTIQDCRVCARCGAVWPVQHRRRFVSVPPVLGASGHMTPTEEFAEFTAARPRVAPFTADAAQAVESPACLDPISADYVLPGHGDPWTGGVQEAIRQIRQQHDSGSD